MAIHTIMLPDRRFGRAMRTILWDDVAGTFDGDHGDVPWLNEQVDGREPGWLAKDEIQVWLQDPAHSPGDLIWLLGFIWAGVHTPSEIYQGIAIELPPVFDGGETELEHLSPLFTFPDGHKARMPAHLIDKNGDKIGHPPPNAEYTLTDESGPDGTGRRTVEGPIVRFCLA
ncbi:MAG: hypothetical protein GDA49_11770 [Rhodospirillales bacterium]|nr:hypothetical protein [Rhodospirillales bacterium]